MVSQRHIELAKRIYDYPVSAINLNQSEANDFTFILFSARSGSTYLSSLIKNQHPKLVEAYEFFAPDLLLYFSSEYDWTPQDLLDKLRCISRNGCQVVWKLSYPHYRRAFSCCPDLQKELLASKKIIRLTRLDLHSQIMSRYLARKTGLWQQYSDGSNTIFKNISNTVTDNLYFEMADALNFIISSELGWDDFLKTASKCATSLHLNYEQLVSESAQTLNLIEEYIGLPVTSQSAFDAGKSGLSPQKLNSSYSEEELSVLRALITRISSISFHTGDNFNA